MAKDDLSLAQLATDLSRSALMVCDRELNIVFLNPAAEALIGRSQKRLLHHRLEEIGPWGTACAELSRRAFQTEQKIASRDQIIIMGNQRVLANIHAIPDEDHVVLTLDSRLAHEEAVSTRSAAEAAVGFGRLLSHELKNPIAGARGAAQLLSQDTEGDLQALARLIMTELDRASRIADHWSRVGDIVPQPFTLENLNILAREAINSLQAARPSSVSITERFDPSLPELSVDRDLVLQAVLNLLTNAVEACQGEAEPHIIIRSRYRQPAVGDPAPEARLTIEVEDNGPGVPESLRGSLFNPFVTSKDAGEGLGLAFVSRVADLHAGAIEFDSQPGQTLFRLHLHQNGGVS